MPAGNLTTMLGSPPVIRLPMEATPRQHVSRAWSFTGDSLEPEFFHFDAHESMLGQVNYTPAAALLSSREIDSGIDDLETPLDSGESTSSASSSPRSTVSAPAAVASSSTAGSVGSVSAEMSSPTSTSPSLPAVMPSPWALFDRRQDDFAMAQLVHPADAVVFVGNLPFNIPDHQISTEIYETFKQYGRVSVYIKRTTIQKPWALLQYQTPDEARQAIRHGARLNYLGRGLRVMRSVARRQIALRRVDLPLVWAPNELQAAFHEFGQIDQTVQRIDGYGLVRFRCYGSYALAKDAIRSGTTPYAFW